MSMSNIFQFLSLCTSNIHGMDHQLWKEGGWGGGGLIWVDREFIEEDRRRGIMD